MKKQQVLDLLQIHQERIEEFAVKSLSLFGSVARDEATPDSDVDLLVEFQHPVGLFTLLSLKSFLEEILCCPVDLGTPNSLRPHLRDTVLGEAIRAI
ncbi:MAG: nucleotidyltransferase family protein [Cyanobacteria bacterium P01_B01_bin.77]